MIQPGDRLLVKYYARIVLKDTILEFQNYFDMDVAAVLSATNPRANVVVVEGCIDLAHIFPTAYLLTIVMNTMETCVPRDCV